MVAAATPDVDTRTPNVDWANLLPPKFVHLEIVEGVHILSPLIDLNEIFDDFGGMMLCTLPSMLKPQEPGRVSFIYRRNAVAALEAAAAGRIELCNKKLVLRIAKEVAAEEAEDPPSEVEAQPKAADVIQGEAEQTEEEEEDPRVKALEGIRRAHSAGSCADALLHWEAYLPHVPPKLVQASMTGFIKEYRLDDNCKERLRAQKASVQMAVSFAFTPGIAADNSVRVCRLLDYMSRLATTTQGAGQEEGKGEEHGSEQADEHEGVSVFERSGSHPLANGKAEEETQEAGPGEGADEAAGEQERIEEAQEAEPEEGAEEAQGVQENLEEVLEAGPEEAAPEEVPREQEKGEALQEDLEAKGGGEEGVWGRDIFLVAPLQAVSPDFRSRDGSSSPRSACSDGDDAYMDVICGLPGWQPRGELAECDIPMLHNEEASDEVKEQERCLPALMPESEYSLPAEQGPQAVPALPAASEDSVQAQDQAPGQEDAQAQEERLQQVHEPESTSMLDITGEAGEQEGGAEDPNLQQEEPQGQPQAEPEGQPQEGIPEKDGRPEDLPEKGRHDSEAIQEPQPPQVLRAIVNLEEDAADEEELPGPSPSQTPPVAALEDEGSQAAPCPPPPPQRPVHVPKRWGPKALDRGPAPVVVVPAAAALPAPADSGVLPPPPPPKRKRGVASDELPRKTMPRLERDDKQMLHTGAPALEGVEDLTSADTKDSASQEGAPPQPHMPRPPPPPRSRRQEGSLSMLSMDAALDTVSVPEDAETKARRREELREDLKKQLQEAIDAADKEGVNLLLETLRMTMSRGG